MTLNKNLGMLALALWLILTGLSGLGVGFSGMGTVMAVIALLAGILILLGR